MDAPRILKFRTPREAAEACGARTFELLDEARRERGIATLAVSGGSTPRIMFEWMAGQPFDWSGVHIFQVDERCFPPGHPQSNFRMLRESLLDAARIPEAQVHRVLGERDPAEAARIYCETIRKVLQLGPEELPAFDVIQRGMGPDAHTASLFPGEPAIEDCTGLAAALRVEKMQQHRVTLLRGVLEKAKSTLLLVSGPDKAEALRSVLKEPFDPLRYPCQIASPETVWFIDEAAASRL
jgi:6-phosphogluconolactonase